MADILKEILAHKAEEVTARARARPLAELARQCEGLPPARGFADAIEARVAAGRAAVISEIKKASPSRGVMREDFRPGAIAESYAAHGAACLSVLTDERYFMGHDDFLGQARAACNLPALRKDFIIDPYQVYESRLIGADAVLLIVAALGDALMRELAELAQALGMDLLVEVHDGEELERALRLPCRLIGINNRNLRSFETRLQTTLDLLPALGGPAHGRIVVTESGIHTRDDVALMREHGVHAFLVGEAFMRAPQPGEALAELFAEPAS